MALQDRVSELRTPEQVDQFLTQNPNAAIFKAGTCHKTMQGWGNIETLLRDREDVQVGIVRVVESRPASNHIADLSGVTHQSPQIIVFKDGQPLFDLDNWDITTDALEPLLSEHLGAVSGSGAPLASDLRSYKQLLDGFIGGQLSQEQFQFTYLQTFKQDNALRSQAEFDLLNSLFGNPDEHHIHPAEIISLEPMRETPLLARAQQVRQQLEAL